MIKKRNPGDVAKPVIVPGSSLPIVAGRTIHRPSSPTNREELVPLLTTERLGSYLAATASADAAIKLYEWNMAVSASVLKLTGIVEVVLRNALDHELQSWITSKYPGASWFDRAPLDTHGQADLVKARSRATRHGKYSERHGRVIAELTLGFWRYLVESRYLTSIWMPATHKAFPNGPFDPLQRQRAVKQHLQQLHFVRNRAAHHEPIHTRNLANDFNTALELLSWVTPNAASWAHEISSLPGIISRKP